MVYIKKQKVCKGGGIMELSDEFIKATKLSNLKYYELATIGGLTQVSFSQYINRTRKIIGDIGF